MDPRSDPELLLALSSDRSAFEAFYRRHIALVTAFAARRCRTAANVADAVSNTFLSVLDSSGQFDPKRGSARSWLLGITAHEISAIQRREDRQRRAESRFAHRELLEEDEIEALEARIEAERVAPRIAALLASATRTEREIFLLVAYDGLTPAEAARTLDISPVAARVRLSRVRRRLRRSTQILPASTPITPDLERTS